MTTKATGVEFKRFYADTAFWPPGAYHDDEEVTIDGRTPAPEDDLSLVADSAQMTLANGIVFLNEKDDEGPSFESHFKKWRKTQTTVSFVVECHKDLLDLVKACIKQAGGKVI